MNEVVCLKEYGSQTRLSYRIVFEIEFVEPMETVRVGLGFVSIVYNEDSRLLTCISSVSILRS